jgi:hypothetical protein
MHLSYDFICVVVGYKILGRGIGYRIYVGYIVH